MPKKRPIRRTQDVIEAPLGQVAHFALNHHADDNERGCRRVFRRVGAPSRAYRVGSSIDIGIQFIDDEAEAEGPEAVAELHAFDARFRIAAELLEARKQAHMTQRDLAAASGVQQAEMISRIERGEITPGVSTVDRLVRPLGRRLAVVEDRR